MKVSQQNIILASQKIKNYIHKTPVLKSEALDKLVGALLYFKCENFQKTGSFKIRGATNAVFSLSNEEAQYGVVTHSSGNHGAALAQAAAWRGIKCYVITPESSPQVKKEALKSYGAAVFYSGATLASREAETKRVMKKTAACLIHPFNNDTVICGQGTSALELLNETGELDYVFAPVGGGGLLSGTSTYSKEQFPKTRVIGAEPELANDAYLSLKSGKLHAQLPPKTIADGLRTAMCARTFKIVQKYVDDIVVVSDQEIVAAMLLVWERMKIIIEPSSAAPVAAVIKIKEKLHGKKVGIIISGGNVDFKEILSFL